MTLDGAIGTSIIPIMMSPSLGFSTVMLDETIEGDARRQMKWIECHHNSECSSCDYGYKDSNKAHEGTLIDGVALKCECDTTGVNDCDCGHATCPYLSTCDLGYNLGVYDEGDCAPGLYCRGAKQISPPQTGVCESCTSCGDEEKKHSDDCHRCNPTPGTKMGTTDAPPTSPPAVSPPLASYPIS